VKAIDILNADRDDVDARLMKVNAMMEKLGGSERWWKLKYEKNALESRLSKLDREQSEAEEKREALRARQRG